MRVVANCSY